MNSRSDLNDDSRMPFGKWRGERLADIPDDYWNWLKKQPGIQFSSPSLWRWLNKDKNESTDNTGNTDQLQFEG